MLYLVDKPLADVAIRTATDDPDPHIILVQDGVYLSPSPALSAIDGPVSAMEGDVRVRGVETPEDVRLITYDELVELLNEHEVRTFV